MQIFGNHHTQRFNKLSRSGKYTFKKPGRHYLFLLLIVKNGIKNTKRIAYKSLVRPILEYVAVCWDPYGECQINALGRVQNKAA
jgi:hypothetical protein